MNSNTFYVLKNISNHIMIFHYTIIHNINMKNLQRFTFKKPDLGRWGLSTSKIIMDKKIDYANYDNCFTVIKK